MRCSSSYLSAEKFDETADALDGGEALIAEDFDQVGALVLIARREIDAHRFGIAERFDEPAEVGGRRRRRQRAVGRDFVIRLQAGERIGAA